MILLIDNYDSFTYNLFQQISSLGKEVKVVRNNAITVDEIRKMQPEAIVISPGPGTPSEAGISIEVIKNLYTEFPILGICLGHQSIAEAFGAKIIRAPQIKHGLYSTVKHTQTGLFEKCPESVSVMRYHSLVIDKKTLHPELQIIAIAEDDHEIMAIQHQEYPVFGLQFHPESIGTKDGDLMIQMFLDSYCKEVV
ncbi:anthranilate synthase component II [Rummeliibacillus sp. NPDC094406]|uniref:anthranilate synthase component II n=1 Tax=Rummeliibacillus sp. NPDC094406 TaxID=3364511 RepID=UPI003811A818